MSEIKNGDIVTDIVTGFTGVVTAISHYINGCVEVLVTPQKCDEKGDYPKSTWLDLKRLKIVGKHEEVISARTSAAPIGGPGDPSEAPITR